MTKGFSMRITIMIAITILVSTTMDYNIARSCDTATKMCGDDLLLLIIKHIKQISFNSSKMLS